MPNIDKKKTKEKGVPIIDFEYIFFGRHKEHRAAKYFTVFVFLFIFVALAAYFLQPPQIAQPQYQTPISKPTTTIIPQQQQMSENIFAPSPQKTQYGPEVVYLNNNPSLIGWEYSLPKDTVVKAVDSGTLQGTPTTDRTYDQILRYKSSDGKWVITYRISGAVLELKENDKEISKGDKLFTINAENGDLLVQVLKLDDECVKSTTTVCPYTNPEEYFNR